MLVFYLLKRHTHIHLLNYIYTHTYIFPFISLLDCFVSSEKICSKKGGLFVFQSLMEILDISSAILTPSEYLKKMVIWNCNLRSVSNDAAVSKDSKKKSN